MKPPVVILCGGRGTRLRERTESVPKALVEIGGRPILWHVIQIYAAQGFERFLLATGYMGEAVAEFAAAERWPDGVAVECVDTGLDTPTGGRIARARRAARRRALLRHLRRRRRRRRPRRPARLPPRARRPGDDDRRPAAPAVGGGGAARATASPASSRSRAASTGSTAASSASSRACSTTSTRTACWSASRCTRLAADGELRAFRHEGFWDCMDTYKDAVVLNDLWASGAAPWRIWDAAAVEAR